MEDEGKVSERGNRLGVEVPAETFPHGEGDFRFDFGAEGIALVEVDAGDVMRVSAMRS